MCFQNMGNLFSPHFHCLLVKVPQSVSVSPVKGSEICKSGLDDLLRIRTNSSKYTLVDITAQKLHNLRSGVF